MNILIATDVFPPKSGGSGWSTYYLARALLARGHRVEIVEPKADMDGIRTRTFEGMNVVQVGYRASALPGVRAWQRTRALQETLSAYLAKRAPEFDVLHAQHVLTISAAAAAKKIAPIRLVSTVRDYWAVCLYGTLWRENAICPVCHGSELTKCLAQKYGDAARWMQPAVPFVERELERRQRALQASDAVIAVSHFVASVLQGIVPADKLHVIPNLIDVDETTAEAASAQIESPDEYVMFIGKLNRLKGADLLPEIMDRSGVQIPLVVAGDGELKNDLARARYVDIRGWLPNRATLGLLARAKALIFPSRWADPLARTLLEAQALGVPTVAWNSGGTCDIIESNFNGWLADNVVDLSSYVGRLVGDPTLCSRLGANAKRVAEEKFSPRTVVPKLEAVYSDRVPTLVSGVN